MEVKMVENNILAVTDDAIVPQSEVMNAIRVVKKEGIELIDPMIITQAASWSRLLVNVTISIASLDQTPFPIRHEFVAGQLPVESSSMDIIVLMCKLAEFPGDDLVKDILRVLKPGGIILLHPTSLSTTGPSSNAIVERKLLLAGFLDVKSSEIGQSLGIIGKKPSWKIGSSFSIKKTTQRLPKVQIDDDMDLIDEDSLLTEDDLKRPQLPPVDDCEVGSTRKACKNCTCGRAEAEEKVNLAVTMDQLNNPQSACGNCGLGDAFRCSTCPYKGLPAFKLGEKVTLSGNFLAADI